MEILYHKTRTWPWPYRIWKATVEVGYDPDIKKYLTEVCLYTDRGRRYQSVDLLPFDARYSISFDEALEGVNEARLVVEAMLPRSPVVRFLRACATELATMDQFTTTILRRWRNAPIPTSTEVPPEE